MNYKNRSRTILTFVFLLGFSIFTNAQRNADNYFGFIVGTTIYYGDLPRTNKIALGMQFVNEDDDSHISFRGQISFGTLKSQQTNSYDQVFVKFHSSFIEAAILPEYNFLLLSTKKITPYIAGGIGFSSYFNKNGYYLGHETKLANYTFDIPFGAGIKYVLNDNVKLRLEYLQRHTFSNKIDGINLSQGKDYWGQATIGINIRLKKLYPSCNTWKKEIY